MKGFEIPSAPYEKTPAKQGSYYKSIQQDLYEYPTLWDDVFFVFPWWGKITCRIAAKNEPVPDVQKHIHLKLTKC